MKPKSQTEWTQEQIDSLVEMWNEGISVREIAKDLDKSDASIKMYVQRYRDKLGLARREFIRVERAKAQDPEFDRKWYGTVPCGHWTITKPWRLSYETHSEV